MMTQVPAQVRIRLLYRAPAAAQGGDRTAENNGPGAGPPGGPRQGGAPGALAAAAEDWGYEGDEGWCVRIYISRSELDQWLRFPYMSVGFIFRSDREVSIGPRCGP
eukprot:COSAG01_NODE_1013_length_12138_cov_7.073926_11_plen_106_part_00